MKCVWKFSIRPGDQYIYMPEGAQILYVSEQELDGVLYALVEPNQSFQRRHVVVLATGEEFSFALRDLHSVGLLKFANGTLMFHVFADSGR